MRGFIYTVIMLLHNEYNLWTYYYYISLYYQTHDIMKLFLICRNDLASRIVYLLQK